MRVEPSADLRAGAIEMFQLFIALTEAGFVESQALYLLGQMMPSPPSGA